MAQSNYTIRGIPKGALMGKRRYQILDDECPDGFHLRQRCEVLTDAFVSGSEDERFLVEAKAIHYGRFSAADGEGFPEYVARRRAELEREARMLALYKQASPRMPQVIDLVRGENTWSDRVIRARLERNKPRLAENEPVLLLERLPGEPLSMPGAPWSVEEALELADGILRTMRAFHGADRGVKGGRHFLPLTPIDVLVDRSSRSCWLQNLWKLRSGEDFAGSAGAPPERIWCLPEEAAFVSPAIVHLLQRPRALAPQHAGKSLAQAALYGVAAVLAYALCPETDFTAQEPGWLDGKRVEALLASRQLASEVRAFVVGLAEHRFDNAQKALEHLAAIRHRGLTALAPILPAGATGSTPVAATAVPAGSLVGQRYRVLSRLSAGGRGELLEATDEHTGARVVLKVPFHPEAVSAQAQVDKGEVPAQVGHRLTAEAIASRREEALNEARNALRVRHRTSSVPQLLDVVFLRSATELIRLHPDPAVHSREEPVLVFERVPGHPLAPDQDWDEQQLLQLARAICTILVRLHEPAADGTCFLYMDWKPENILRHPEHDGYTLIDLGAVVKLSGGIVQGELFHTPPFGALELYDFGAKTSGTRFNRALTVRYDLYGLAAVLWVLAVRPMDLGPLSSKHGTLVDQHRVGVVFDPAAIPARFAELAPILARALAPEPHARQASAREMLAEVEHALGRLTPFPPEPPQELGGKVLSSRLVEVHGRLGVDRSCVRLVLTSDHRPIRDHMAAPIYEANVLGWAPRSPFRSEHTLQAALPEVHYAAFTQGLNGLQSELLTCRVPLVLDPEVLPIERLERGLVLRWRIPAVVSEQGGVVVVERVDPGGNVEVYAGSDSEYRDEELDPTRVFEYRVYSRVPSARSPGVSCSARPLPRLLRLTALKAEGGERCVKLSFAMRRDAATELRFVRSSRPLLPIDLRDRAELELRPGSPPIGLELDALRATGATPGSGVTLQQEDGLLHGQWIDRGVRPGEEFLYSAVLTYAEKGGSTLHWLDLAASASAYAEVEKPEAASLPGAVRLRWRSPSEATGIRLERIDAASSAVWDLPPDASAFLDRVPEGERRYRLRALFGQRVSPGTELVASALPRARGLPRLLALPGEGCARVHADFAGLSPSARVERRDVDPPQVVLRTGETQPVELELPPWERVELALVDGGGQITERASVVPFAEPSVVRAALVPSRETVAQAGDELAVEFGAPAGAQRSLLVLEGAPMLASAPASRRVGFRLLPAGAYRVRVHALGREGTVSSGKSSELVRVPEPTHSDPP